MIKLIEYREQQLKGGGFTESLFPQAIFIPLDSPILFIRKLRSKAPVRASAAEIEWNDKVYSSVGSKYMEPKFYIRKDLWVVQYTGNYRVILCEHSMNMLVSARENALYIEPTPEEETEAAEELNRQMAQADAMGPRGWSRP